MPGDVRKTIQFVEDGSIEGGKRADKPTRMVAVAAVVRNPWTGRGFVENLRAVAIVAEKCGVAITLRMFFENLRRHLRGKKRQNVVNPARGY